MRSPVWVSIVALLAAVSPIVAEDAKPEVKTKLEGHRGGVGAVAFSPDGTKILTGSGNGVARLWDTKTGEMIVKLDPVGGTTIVHVGFSADGSVMSVTGRKAVVAWSLLEPSKPKNIFEESYRESVRRVGGISGDGKRIYFNDMDVNVLSYVDVKPDARRTTDFKTQLFAPLAFATAPDAESSLAVVFGTTGTNTNEKSHALAFVGLGDTWKLTEGIKAPDANPNSLGFSPDSKWLVLCSGGAVQVWKVPGSQKVSGKPRVIELGTGTYTAAAAGPGNLLAIAERSGGEGKKIHVHLVDLAAEQPKALTTFATDIEDVNCFAFSSDGKLLAVADNTEGVVQLWALPAGKK
jgi:WD40 repeat protein